MEWYEKEADYDRRYRSGRVASGASIWSMIPERVREGITQAYADCDGYWIELDHEAGGWTAYDGGEDCGIIHEYTIADLRSAIKTIRRKA